MQNKTLSNILVTFFITFFSFNSVFSFPVSPKRQTQDIQNDQTLVDLDNEQNEDEALKSLLGLFGEGGDTQNVLGEIYGKVQNTLQEKAEKEAKRKFELLPEKYKEIFFNQQQDFKEISLSICFENCIGKIINKIGYELSEAPQLVKEKAKNIFEILNATDYFLDSGHISFLISKDSLNRISKKLDYSYFDLNQIPFYMTFLASKKVETKEQKEEKRIEKFVCEKLKEFTFHLDKFEYLSVKEELKTLSLIFKAISDENLNKLIDACFGYLKNESEKLYKKLGSAEKEFDSLIEKSTGNKDLSEAAQHFLNEIQTYKKSLNAFKSYKRDLDIQKSWFGALSNDFILAGYDLYSKIDYFKVDSKNRFAGWRDLLSWQKWLGKFVDKSEWMDRGFSFVFTSLAFADYLMAMKSLSLFSVARGEVELENLDKNDLALLIDLAKGDKNIMHLVLQAVQRGHENMFKKERLLFSVFFRSLYLYNASNSFSRNHWPLAAALRYSAALISYNYLDENGDEVKKYWPGDYDKIKNTTVFVLKKIKKDIVDFSSNMCYLTYPEMFEKLKDKSLGIIKPELLGLAIDLGMPDITQNFPKSISDLTREGRFLNYNDIQKLGLDNKFIKMKKNGSYNGSYNREEYYEGKVLGYLASSVGGHVGKLVFKKSAPLLLHSFVASALACDTVVGTDLIGALEGLEVSINQQVDEIKTALSQAIVFMGKDASEHIQFLLYHLAWFELLSYSEAARFNEMLQRDSKQVDQMSFVLSFLSGEGQSNDNKKINEDLDEILKAVLDRVWGYMGKRLGSVVAQKGVQWTIDLYGPITPKIKNYFA